MALKSKKPTLSLMETRAINLLPVNLRLMAKEVVLDPQLNELTKLFMDRAKEFKSPAQALLAGMALYPPARKLCDDTLDNNWRNTPTPQIVVPEVIVGGGLHAAIYAAARVASGRKPPLVIERTRRPGGAFACSVGPSFFLNSRNRPGLLSLPGDQQGALNYLPGANLQPADLGGGEYQTNDVIAWTIRMALAQYAKVISGKEVQSIVSSSVASRNGRRALELKLSTGERVFSRRVLIATGLVARETEGTGLRSTGPRSRILNFEQLMARMDTYFPLRDMKRVAVLGAGDSGKTAVEMLTGQGPVHRTSLACLDWVQRIDWYGCPQSNRADWEKCQRSRYRGIGRLMTSTTGPGRVKQMPLVNELSAGLDCVYVNGVPYDHVIDCRGYGTGPLARDLPPEYAIGSRAVARKDELTATFFIGPAAQLEANEQERQILGRIAENNASIFRYAGRTAALAAALT